MSKKNRQRQKGKTQQPSLAQLLRVPLISCGVILALFTCYVLSTRSSHLPATTSPTMAMGTPIASPPAQAKAWSDNLSQQQAREFILKGLTDKPVYQERGLVPVHIFRNNEFWASGTEVLLPGFEAGGVIFTSSHLFMDAFEPATFSYQRLRPLDAANVQRTIEQATYLDNWQANFSIEPDIITCLPGPSATIQTISMKMIDPIANREALIIEPITTTPHWVVSLLSGKRYQCQFMAIDKKSGNIVQLIFECPSIGGESGSGFVLENEPSVLVILGGVYQNLMLPWLPPSESKKNWVCGYPVQLHNTKIDNTWHFSLSPVGTTDNKH